MTKINNLISTYLKRQTTFTGFQLNALAYMNLATFQSRFIQRDKSLNLHKGYDKDCVVRVYLPLFTNKVPAIEKS